MMTGEEHRITNLDIQTHCAEINRCNQRGGRMLSVVDLIDAGTMTREMAAYSLAAIGHGASYLIGALPSGAGKTTVMGALLNFVPGDVRLLPADSASAIERGLHERDSRHCYICHEIGAGPYYAYLWGQMLRRYLELPTVGHMLATNLHADTYGEAREQLCGENQISRVAFRRVNLLYFLTTEEGGRNGKRRIASIWESNGERDHRQVSGANLAVPLPLTSELVSADRFAAARMKLDAIMASKGRTIEAVRTALIKADRTCTTSMP